MAYDGYFHEGMLFQLQTTRCKALHHINNLPSCPLVFVLFFDKIMLLYLFFKSTLVSFRKIFKDKTITIPSVCTTLKQSQ